MLLGSFGFLDTDILSENHNSNNSGDKNESDQFPTSIFENLLQNDELLRALFKPIDSSITSNSNNSNKEVFAPKQTEKMDIDKVEEALDSAKIYGNAFLGPNLWSKDELFPTDELRLSLDLFDSDDFLSGNHLEDVEEKIIEKINTNKSGDSSTKKANKKLEKETSINLSLDDISLSDQNSNFSFSVEKSNRSESDYDSCSERKPSKRKLIPRELKDEKYWNRRRQNNLAAKRSRDSRRLKETEVSMRASFLESENLLLKRQLEDYKQETKLLKMKLARYEKKKN